jgi:drug/metabolite transporter (DMT)-like permease
LSSGRFTAYAATLAFVVLASSAPAVTRFSLAHALGVLDLVVLRCCIAGLVFLPFLLARWQRLPKKLVVTGVVLAFLHGWGMHLVTITGLSYAPAAHASALGPGFMPIWVMILRRLWYGARPSGLQAAGLALIALGALVLVGHSSRFVFENRMVIGDLLFLVSSCLGSAYFVYIQHHGVDPIQATALVSVYSAIVGLLLLASPAPSALWTAPISEVLFQAAYQGVALGACAVLFATYATLRLGSQRFTVFIASIPVLSLILGRVIVGDGIHLFEAAATVLVSAGIFVAGFLSARVQDGAESSSGMRSSILEGKQ